MFLFLFILCFFLWLTLQRRLHFEELDVISFRTGLDSLAIKFSWTSHQSISMYAGEHLSKRNSSFCKRAVFPLLTTSQFSYNNAPLCIHSIRTQLVAIAVSVTRSIVCFSWMKMEQTESWHHTNIFGLLSPQCSRPLFSSLRNTISDVFYCRVSELFSSGSQNDCW